MSIECFLIIGWPPHWSNCSVHEPPTVAKAVPLACTFWKTVPSWGVKARFARNLSANGNGHGIFY